MNKKIEEFAEQCRMLYRVGHGDEYNSEFSLEKFAQLVAQDCVDLIRLQYVGDHVTGHDYRNRGLDAAEFVICLEYGLKKQSQPIESQF